MDEVDLDKHALEHVIMDGEWKFQGRLCLPW